MESITIPGSIKEI
ncbi:hypothetical protein DRZ74_01310, partial [Metamycoplasma hominis]